jgi:hypothetical protein
MSWVLSGCSDYYSASLQVDSASPVSRIFDFTGRSGGPADESVPVGSMGMGITESGSSKEFGSMSVKIQAPIGCNWSVHAHQTQTVAAAPGPTDCVKQIIPMLIRYGRGEIDITAIDALVPSQNRTFAHQQADDTLSSLTLNPSLGDDPSQLFGSGQAAASLCVP